GTSSLCLTNSVLIVVHFGKTLKPAIAHPAITKENGIEAVPHLMSLKLTISVHRELQFQV
ncbi:hypothetical protein, partial [Vibrio anguillarum]|uniref:hypothetical protein n=1 Tax=Vibrio anguillarum TaxID=55601 RepID=UPI001F3933E9